MPAKIKFPSSPGIQVSRKKLLSLLMFTFLTLFQWPVRTHADTMTTVHDFNPMPAGANPRGLVKGSDGAFFGTAANGGEADCGVAFKMTANGTVTILHSFGAGDEAHECGRLVTRDLPHFPPPDIAAGISRA